MTDRHEVHPHHVLRAVLRDPTVGDLLRPHGVEVEQVEVTLAQRWLAHSDTIGIEDVEALGVDVATLLAALGPDAGEGSPTWGGRRLAGPTRDLLVRTLGICGAMRHRHPGSGHLLLALMGCRDAVVAETFAAHGLRARDVRPWVRQWGRRAT